jgi:hypothetical protein
MVRWLCESGSNLSASGLRMWTLPFTSVTKILPSAHTGEPPRPTVPRLWLKSWRPVLASRAMMSPPFVTTKRRPSL